MCLVLGSFNCRSIPGNCAVMIRKYIPAPQALSPFFHPQSCQVCEERVRGITRMKAVVEHWWQTEIL